MNIDTQYFHTRAFRLTTYTTYAELYDLATNANVRVELKDLHTVRQLTADGMRALIEAKQLPVGPAPEPKTENPAIGDLWQNRRGVICAVAHGFFPYDGKLRLTVVELNGSVPNTYTVYADGAVERAGKGERHPLDLIRRTGSFL